VNGLHILAELRGCADGSPMRDVGSLRTLCLDACAAAGLTVVAEAFHGFAGAGATGAVVLAESHLAVHTWPELDAVTLDIYVCNFSQDNRASAEAAFDALRAAFAPKSVARRDVARGELR
jgi:S-adenosylmethionine decarboxylase proenzyme